MTQDQTGRRAGQGKKAGALVKTVLLFALLLLYMAPFFLVVINAFKSNGAILKSPLALVDPKGVTLDNFTKAFERMDFLRSFANSLLVTVVSVALIVLMLIPGTLISIGTVEYVLLIGWAAVGAVLYAIYRKQDIYIKEK